MTDDTPLLDLISYDEMYHIINHKFYVTNLEIRYWIKKSMDEIKSASKTHTADRKWTITLDGLLTGSSSLLIPFASDLPFLSMYEYPPEGFFHPECYFYDKQAVLQFTPIRNLRFVYQKDLTSKRNWNDYKTDNDSLRYRTLLRANECGILRFYNFDIDEFTTHANKNQIWCHTFEGEGYVSNPESPFLLYDILNVERIFFGKDRVACLEELGLISPQLPPNVVDFNKRSTHTESNNP